MGDFSQSPAYGIPAALATAGGAALLSRGGTLGTPLGIALAGLGGYGLDYAARKGQQKQQQRLADALKNITPKDSISDVTQRIVGAGGSLGDAESIYKSMQGPTPSYSMFKEPGLPVERFNSKTGMLEAIQGAPTVPPKPQTQSMFAQFRAANPQLSFNNALKEFKTVSQKSPEQIGAETTARVNATIGALSRQPISKVNSGLVVLGSDGKVLPLASEADVASGKGSIVMKQDVKQLRQVQVAQAAVDRLAQTLDPALPKTTGLVSASGILGRKLTDIANPNKLAAFNAAKFLASDAVIRAVTNRGNKSQFDAAMNDIVGPTATAESARRGIATVKTLLGDIRSQLSNQATDTWTGVKNSAAMGAGGAIEPSDSDMIDLTK